MNDHAASSCGSHNVHTRDAAASAARTTATPFWAQGSTTPRQRAHQTLDLIVPIAYAAQLAGPEHVERVATMCGVNRSPHPRARSRRRGRPLMVYAEVYRGRHVLPRCWQGRRRGPVSARKR